MSEKKFKPRKILQSIISGLFGIQSRKNMEEDFSTGKIQHYVIAGVITVILLILTIYNIAKYVIS